MKIIIVGAGQVGVGLAENLVNENNDITIVDNSVDKIKNIEKRLDVRTLQGSGSHPKVLRSAGAEDADMLIAVTRSDEVNIVACQVANKLFNTPKKIARIRGRYYKAYPELFNDDAFAIDVVITPEQLVTHNVYKLIENPGSLQVLDFADGKVQLVAVRSYYGGPLVGKNLAAVDEHLGKEARVAAIYRRNRALPLTAETMIEPGDEVFFIAASKHISKVMAGLRKIDAPYKRIFLAGGGNIGVGLAERLENKYKVKLIDQNIERARSVAEKLNNTTVLHGNTADHELLISEDIEHTDVFCSMTNDDEANIMAALMAKRLGVRRVMALINRIAYADLIEGSEIDVAISPQYAMVGSILAHVRQGDVVNVHPLRRGSTEALELIAHGDENTSKVVGRKLGEIKLPPGTNIGALVRGEQVIIADDEVSVESGDHVILFMMSKTHLRDVEKLFQVGLNFF